MFKVRGEGGETVGAEKVGGKGAVGDGCALHRMTIELEWPEGPVPLEVVRWRYGLIAACCEKRLKTGM